MYLAFKNAILKLLNKKIINVFNNETLKSASSLKDQFIQAQLLF